MGLRRVRSEGMSEGVRGREREGRHRLNVGGYSSTRALDRAQQFVCSWGKTPVQNILPLRPRLSSPPPLPGLCVKFRLVCHASAAAGRPPPPVPVLNMRATEVEIVLDPSAGCWACPAPPGCSCWRATARSRPKSGKTVASVCVCVCVCGCA